MQNESNYIICSICARENHAQQSDCWVCGNHLQNVNANSTFENAPIDAHLKIAPRSKSFLTTILFTLGGILGGVLVAIMVVIAFFVALFTACVLILSGAASSLSF